MRTNKILFFIVILLLILPLIQSAVPVFSFKDLKGAFNKKVNNIAHLSWESWMNGEFQKSFDKFTEHNIGFRNPIIRIHNQIDFSCFRKINTFNTIIGKQNYLYQGIYIDALKGRDYIGSSFIKNSVARIKAVQDTLATLSKRLVFVIAPGKASIFPEFIPDSCNISDCSITNYDNYIQEFKSNEVDFIDFRKYFQQIKPFSKYPLFPKTGIHWSGYGITLVADSLFKNIEAKSDFNIINYKIVEGVSTSKDYRFTDNDAGKTLNLLFNIPNDKVYYPKIIFIPDTLKHKPNVLLVGDSFTQGFYSFYPLFDSVFSKKSTFWYYFKNQAWPKYFKDIARIDFNEKINETDIFIIVSTEQNLKKFGFGIIEELFHQFFPEKEINNSIAKIETNIKNDSLWLKRLEKKANARKISLIKQIYLEAKYNVINKLINKSKKQDK